MENQARRLARTTGLGAMAAKAFEPTRRASVSDQLALASIAKKGILGLRKNKQRARHVFGASVIGIGCFPVELHRLAQTRQPRSKTAGGRAIGTFGPATITAQRKQLSLAELPVEDTLPVFRTTPCGLASAENTPRPPNPLAWGKFFAILSAVLHNETVGAFPWAKRTRQRRLRQVPKAKSACLAF